MVGTRKDGNIAIRWIQRRSGDKSNRSRVKKENYVQMGTTENEHTVTNTLTEMEHLKTEIKVIEEGF